MYIAKGKYLLKFIFGFHLNKGCFLIDSQIEETSIQTQVKLNNDAALTYVHSNNHKNNCSISMFTQEVCNRTRFF